VASRAIERAAEVDNCEQRMWYPHPGAGSPSIRAGEAHVLCSHDTDPALLTRPPSKGLSHTPRVQTGHSDGMHKDARVSHSPTPNLPSPASESMTAHAEDEASHDTAGYSTPCSLLSPAQTAPGARTAPGEADIHETLAYPKCGSSPHHTKRVIDLTRVSDGLHTSIATPFPPTSHRPDSGVGVGVNPGLRLASLVRGAGVPGIPHQFEEVGDPLARGNTHQPICSSASIPGLANDSARTIADVLHGVGDPYLYSSPASPTVGADKRLRPEGEQVPPHSPPSRSAGTGSAPSGCRRVPAGGGESIACAPQGRHAKRADRGCS
jgi:hypothetical protein